MRAAVALSFVLGLLIGLVRGDDDYIVSGKRWQDTDGNPIEAHGAGFLKVGDVYYWYGETAKAAPASDHGFSCYSSTDLVNWDYQGLALTQDSIPDNSFPGFDPPYVFERPKVIYNNITNLYVLWFHLDSSNYGMRYVGVATSQAPDQPFTFVHGFKPDGVGSLDMSVYQDEKGAYLVRSCDNSYVGISRLSDDYMTTTGIVSKISQRREGHAIFHYESRYYMLTSHLTGWSANAMDAFVSDRDSLSGAKWKSIGNPTGSKNTFNSQSAYVLPLQNDEGKTAYIYMGDRWDYPHLDQASYIWLPIEIKHSSANSVQIKIEWKSKWLLGDLNYTSIDY